MGLFDFLNYTVNATSSMIPLIPFPDLLDSTEATSSSESSPTTYFWFSSTKRTEISNPLLFMAAGFGVGVFLLVVILSIVLYKLNRCKCRNSATQTLESSPSTPNDVAVSMSHISQVVNISRENFVSHNKAE